MSGHHIGEKTNHQRERLGEHAKQLDGRHYGDGLEEDGHVGPEDFLPIFPVSEQIDGEEGAEREEERDVDVARHVGSARKNRYQTHEIRHQDEEKHREQIRRIAFVVLLADGFLDDVVVNHHHEHFHGSHEASRGGVLLRATLVPTGTTEENHQQNGHHNPNLQHIARDAQVERSHRAAVGHSLVNLAVGLFIEEKAVGQRVMGAKVPFSRLFAADDDGQGNAQVLALVRGDMPFVSVGQVLEHHLRNVQRLAFFLLAGMERQRQEYQRQREKYIL